VVEQPQRAIEPGDPAPHRGRRHLADRLYVVRRIGAVLAEQQDEWAECRRYLGLDVLAKSRLTTIRNDGQKEDQPLPDLSA
jgi:hypothetical protein